MPDARRRVRRGADRAPRIIRGDTPMKRTLSILVFVTLLFSLAAALAYPGEGTYLISALSFADEAGSTVNVTLETAADARLVVTALGADGEQIGASVTDVGARNGFQTKQIPLSGARGRIYKVTAYLLDAGSLSPLCDPVSLYGNTEGQYAVTALRVADGVFYATVTTAEACFLKVQVLSEDREILGAAMGSLDAGMALGEGCARPDIRLHLPAYFVLQAVIVDESGIRLSNTYTTLRYTRGGQESESRSVSDYAGRVTMDFGEAGYAVLAEGARRIGGNAMPDGDGAYLLPAGTEAQPGEILLVTADGREEPLKVKSASVNADGTVRVTRDGDVTVSGIYDVYRVDETVSVGDPSYEITASAEKADEDRSGEIVRYSVGPLKFGPLSVTLTGKGSVHIRLLYDKNLLGEDYYETETTFESDITVKVVATGKILSTDYLKYLDASNSQFAQGEGLEITLFDAPVAGFKGIGDVSLKVSVPLSLDLEAEISAAFDIKVISGSSYNPIDGKQPIKMHTLEPKAETCAAAKITFKAGVKVELYAEILHEMMKASLSAEIGFKLTAEAEKPLYTTDDSKLHGCSLCLAGEGSVYITAKLSLTYRITKRLSGTLLEMDLFPGEDDGLSFKLFDCHLSLINEENSLYEGRLHFGFGKCANYKYKSHLQTLAADGTMIFDVPLDIARDGKKLPSGKSVMETWLYPGNYTLSAVMGGFRYTTEFAVTAQGKTVVLQEASATVKGKAVNCADGTPVKDVKVYARCPETGKKAYALTDAEGNFTVTVPQGKYIFAVNDDRRFEKFEKTLQLDMGDVIVQDLQLLPLSVLSCTVTSDAEDTPIANAFVRCIADGKVCGASTTDREGRCSLYLPAGNYTLTVTGGGSWYPEEEEVTLTANQTLETVWRLQKAAYIHYRNKTSKLADLWFYLYDPVMNRVREDALDMTRITAEDGGFLITIRPGDYLLSCEENRKISSSAVYATSPIDRFDVHAEPGEEITLESTAAGCRLVFSVAPDREPYTDAVAQVRAGEHPQIRLADGENTGGVGPGDPGPDGGAQFIGWMVHSGGHDPSFVNKSYFSVFAGEFSMLLCAVWEDPSGFRYAYNCEQDRWELVGYTGGETSVTVPSEVNGHPIGALYGTFYGNRTVESVTTEDGIAVIGSGTFHECDSLRRCAFGEGTVCIESAFTRCGALTEAVLPSSLRVLSGAFIECEALRQIALPEGLTVIGNGSFYASGLTEIRVPSSVRSVGESAFRDCKSLIRAELPASVTVGSGAFNGCESLNAIVTPMLPASACEGCKSLESIVLPDGIRHIADGAFLDNTRLKSIFIPASVRSVGNRAFSGCRQLGRIELPASVLTVGNGAFSGCAALERAGLPESLLSLGASAFSGCGELSTLVMPDSVRSAGSGAFAECGGLYHVKLSCNLSAVASGLFSGCAALEEIEIPASAEGIGQNAFQRCAALKKVTVLSPFTTVQSTSFTGCGALSDLYTPAGSRAETWFAKNMKNVAVHALP